MEQETASTKANSSRSGKSRNKSSLPDLPSWFRRTLLSVLTVAICLLFQQIYIRGFVDPFVNYIKNAIVPESDPRKIAVFFSSELNTEKEQKEIKDAAQSAKKDLCKSVNQAIDPSPNPKSEARTDCFIEVELIDQDQSDVESQILDDPTYVAVIGYATSSTTSEKLEQHFCGNPQAPLIVFPFATSTSVKDEINCGDLVTLRLPRTNQIQGEYIANSVEAIVSDIRNMKNVPSGDGSKDHVQIWMCEDSNNSTYSADLLSTFKKEYKTEIIQLMSSSSMQPIALIYRRLPGARMFPTWD